MIDKCGVKKCREFADISIHSQDKIIHLCDKHWEKACKETTKSSELKDWLTQLNNRILRRKK